MPKFKSTVHVFRKPAVLNPEEKPITAELQHLGFKGVSKLSAGRCFIVEHEEESSEIAKTQIAAMCDKLLVNHVTDTYKVESVAPIP